HADQLPLLIRIVQIVGVEAKIRMAENDSFSLLAFQRTGKDAAQPVVFRVRKITGPEQEMVAVGKKHGPAVGLIILGPDALGDRRHPRPIGIDALQRTLGVRGIDDYTLASPTATASSQSGSEHLWRSACDRHLLELAICEKSNVGVIGRPKRITCSLRAGQKRHAR